MGDHSRDYDEMARRFIREARGPVTQVQASERLGYGTNVLYRWESGRRQPRAWEALALTMACGVDAERLWLNRPPWDVIFADAGSPEGFVDWLAVHVPYTSQEELAQRTGLSRHAIGRLLSGEAQPRLSDMFRLLDLQDGDLDGWWANVLGGGGSHDRSAFVRHPILRWLRAALSLPSYLALPEHEDAWLARRLRRPVTVISAALRAGERAGLVSFSGGKWRLVDRAYRSSVPGAYEGIITGYVGHIEESMVTPEVAEDATAMLFTSSVTPAVADQVFQLFRVAYSEARALIAAEKPGDCLVSVGVLGWLSHPDEAQNGSNPYVVEDSDGDGIPDDVEQAAGTDPHLADTDGDRLSDL